MTSEISNNYVMNPYTGRLIKKGSITYKRLVSAKLLNKSIYSSPENNIILEADNPAQEP